MTTHHPREFPIILMTGTPGTGKSTHAQYLASASSTADVKFEHINVSELVKEKGFHEGWDEEWKTWIMDEDKLLDYLEIILNPTSGPAPTGFIIDHHSPSLFPERWVDLAVVYTCPNETLYQRLADRGYEGNKITENVTAEIMQTVLEETRESYAEEIVVVLESGGEEGEIEGNVERIVGWVDRWIEEGAGKGHEGVEDREEREELEGRA